MAQQADLNAVRVTLAQKLEAEGLKVTLDPRNVNAPMVVIGLPVVTDRLTSCALACEIEVTAVAPGPGNLDAVEWLLDTAAVLFAVLDSEDGRPTEFQPAPGSGASPLPAYVVVVTTHAD